MKTLKSHLSIITGIVVAMGVSNCLAATSYTIASSSADAFLAAGNANTNLAGLNYGAAGTLAVASASSPNGAFDSIIQFNAAGAASQFNSLFGPGNWGITGIQLSLASNFGTNGAHPNNGLFGNISGGQFGINWVGYNSWNEGTGSGTGTPGYPANNMVSYNSIPTLMSAGSDSLGTFTFNPPGNNVYANYNIPLDANLLSEATSGGEISLFFFAADNQISYLFNSHEATANRPELTFTVTVVPEPGVMALLAVGLGGLCVAGYWRKHG